MTEDDNRKKRRRGDEEKKSTSGRLKKQRSGDSDAGKNGIVSVRGKQIQICSKDIGEQVSGAIDVFSGTSVKSADLKKKKRLTKKDQGIYDRFMRGLASLKAQLDDSERTHIAIYCRHGRERSPALLTLYLIKYGNMNPDAAMNLVKRNVDTAGGYEGMVSWLLQYHPDEHEDHHQPGADRRTDEDDDAAGGGFGGGGGLTGGILVNE